MKRRLPRLRHGCKAGVIIEPELFSVFIAEAVLSGMAFVLLLISNRSQKHQMIIYLSDLENSGYVNHYLTIFRLW